MARELLANREAQPVMWWTGPEPTPTGERESFHDHETGSHYIALYTAPPAPAVPDGYKLMPLEITDEIGEAIAMEARCCGGIALDIYEAALAAAPEGGNG